jgi:hypothetical protein
MRKKIDKAKRTSVRERRNYYKRESRTKEGGKGENDQDEEK